MEGLTEGRIVHFVLDCGKHRPAIITQVVDAQAGWVDLQVFLATDDYERRAEGKTLEWRAGFDPDGRKPRSWHWIERA